MSKFWRKFKSIVCDSFLFVLIYEILEEIIEELLADLLVFAFSDMLSTFLCIGLTQSIKYTIKRTVKLVTYKEGNDKMKLLKKICYDIYFNKCTIIMTLLSAFSAYSAYVLIPGAIWLKAMVCALILCIGIACSINIGWENYDQIENRLKEDSIKRQARKENRKVKKEYRIKNHELNKIEKQIKKDEFKKFKEEEENRRIELNNKIKESALNKYQEIVNEKNAQKENLNKQEEISVNDVIDNSNNILEGFNKSLDANNQSNSTINQQQD